MKPLVPTLNIRSALVWKLVETLCHRPRPGLELSLTMTSPGGGQYRCVTLMRRDTWESVAMMNVLGRRLLLHQVGAPRLEWENVSWHDEGYQIGLIENGVSAVADDVEALLGLPPWTGPTPTITAPLLSIRLIAAVMQRVMFLDEPVIADSGFADSSAEGESCVHSWVGAFPEVSREASAAMKQKDWRRAARHASRIWELRGPGGTVLLDLATGEARADASEAAQLARWYRRNGYRLAPLIEWTVDHLYGR